MPASTARERDDQLRWHRCRERCAGAPNGRIVVCRRRRGPGTSAWRACVPMGRRHYVWVRRRRTIDFGGGQRVPARRGAAGGRQDLLAGRSDLQVAVAPEPQRPLSTPHLPATVRSSSVGRFSQAMSVLVCPTARSCSGLLRTRGRQHPGCAPERQRRARQYVRHGGKSPSTSAATISGTRLRARPTGVSSSPAIQGTGQQCSAPSLPGCG